MACRRALWDRPSFFVACRRALPDIVPYPPGHRAFPPAIARQSEKADMRSTRLICALACAFAPIAFAQAPTVSGLLNNYSYTLPGLPNYGIAQGSIFDIFGAYLDSTRARSRRLPRSPSMAFPSASP